MSAALRIVQESWSDAAPNWVLVLAQICDRTSQRKAAEAIRYSAGVVNGVLKNSYAGNLNAVQKAVEGAFMKQTVDCPVLQQLPAHKCIEIQRRKLVATSTQNVRLWRACRGGCKHFMGAKE